MAKKLIIDLTKLRGLKDIPVEGILKRNVYASSFKSIRELATFMFTCRRCEKAPCIEACPAGALEKNQDGYLSRAMLRCIRCKSCIVICPFGTMMDNLFVAKNSGRKFIPISSEKELQEFAGFFPANAVSMVDMEENPAEHVFRFSDNILIKEFTWD